MAWFTYVVISPVFIWLLVRYMSKIKTSKVTVEDIENIWAVMTFPNKMKKRVLRFYFE